MRLLIVNPNSSEGVTARIAAAAEQVARPGDEFMTVSAPSDVPLIVTEADGRRAAAAVADLVAKRAAGFDGIVIASFGDTGADAARRLTDRPVIGIARAAILAALSVAERFDIVSFSPTMTPGFEATLARYGLGDRLRAVHAVRQNDLRDPGALQARLTEDLSELCRAAETDGARCIIMGGGPLAGAAAAMRGHVRIPVIDGVEAAIAMMRLIDLSRGGSAAAHLSPVRQKETLE